VDDSSGVNIEMIVGASGSETPDVKGRPRRTQAGGRVDPSVTLAAVLGNLLSDRREDRGLERALRQSADVLIPPPAASPLRRDRELQTVSHAALVVQHCQLVLHRLFGYAVPSSDLTIRQSFQNRTEQLPLSRSPSE